MKLQFPGRYLAFSFAVAASSLFSQTASLGPTYTLPDTPLGAFQNSVLPGSILATDPIGGGPGDHGFLLGSIGSGLFRSFLEGPNVYWMVTDRGPNPMNGTVRTFPVPSWTPFLIKVRTTGSS